MTEANLPGTGVLKSGQRIRKSSDSPPKLLKRDSDMNLIPQELHKQWFESDESKFDREKHMVVLCPNIDQSKPSRITVVDVDYQSRTYGKAVSILNLPKTGDDLAYCTWPRNARVGEVSDTCRNLLIVPCGNTSRIYVVAIDENTSLKVTKCIEKSDFLRWDLSYPLSACNGSGSGGTLLVCTMADAKGDAKGDIMRLEQRYFTLERKMIDSNEVYTSTPEDSPSANYMSSNISKSGKFGGTMALLYKHGIMFTTEWGDISRLEKGFRAKVSHEDNVYGSAINVWDVQRRRLKQTLHLPPHDGQMTVCIRMLHHVELIHGYICSAIGGSVFHLHKSTKTGLYSADRVIKFPHALVDGWDETELPAFPADMVISMDDDFLFVACWLHGFISQFDITDPFKPTFSKRIFLGGLIHRHLGVELLSVASANFSPRKRTVGGKTWEGGPARLQLSMDGRRLYVTNSFYRPWDEQIYPAMIKNGSSIALIHMDAKNNEMKFDDNFIVRFDGNDWQDEGQKFLAREMRFLNGDCTSDIF
ncbi:56kDa selenium binding protein (SBP56) domain-containing protein [Ditylenchus destructor]|nr:56kDa selenium binding protein (SBP56) domain-containing protein [Ditylenchus destructor]